MKDVKDILSSNLLLLRKNKGITQKDLSEGINVSDKSISRWERGDSVPDLQALKDLAVFYDVSVDYLLSERQDISENKQKYLQKVQRLTKLRQIIITLMLICSVWLVGSFLFVYFMTVYSVNMWQVFLWCVPSSFATICVTNFMWKYSKLDILYYSVFIWSLLLSVYFQLYEYNFYFVFIIGVPVQVAILLYSVLKKNKI